MCCQPNFHCYFGDKSEGACINSAECHKTAGLRLPLCSHTADQTSNSVLPLSCIWCGQRHLRLWFAVWSAIKMMYNEYHKRAWENRKTAIWKFSALVSKKQWSSLLATKRIMYHLSWVSCEAFSIKNLLFKELQNLHVFLRCIYISVSASAQA